jgi:hypothetical protein
MPYERWGFSLLPGANGQMTPDAPHSAQSAPPGTVWASEPTGSRPLDTFVDPHQAMQAISGAPRVPSPGTLRMIPGGSIAPNFMRGAELRPGLDVDMTATGSIERADQAPANPPPASQWPADPLPTVYPVPVPNSPVRKEEVEGNGEEWRPRLEQMLVHLGAFSPPSRLGRPIASIEGMRRFCAAPSPQAASTDAPESR